MMQWFLKPSNLSLAGAMIAIIGALISAYGAYWASQEQAKLEKKLSGNITGGNSFCRFIIMKENESRLTFLLVHSGKYPLYDLKIRIVDMIKYNEVASKIRDMTIQKSFELDTNIDIGNLVPNSPLTFRQITKWYDPKRDHYLYDIYYVARNGFWVQTLELRLVEDNWTKASIVRKPTDNDASLLGDLEIDSNFPNDEKNLRDWSDVKKTNNIKSE